MLSLCFWLLVTPNYAVWQADSSETKSRLQKFAGAKGHTNQTGISLRQELQMVQVTWQNVRYVGTE